ncbi:MAG: transcriptional regulator NrdR [Actinomycetota bacterium]|nr:transcriptional regulator NrdR [Actinomycetota bacterium]
MRCPYCNADDDAVVDSRPAAGGATVRRRRACRVCGQRFSTVERVEHSPLAVRKRNGTSEPFDRAKLRSGVDKATTNLAVSPEAVARAVAGIEARVRGVGRSEVTSAAVGAEVLAALRTLHPVAYVRFASVHKGFTSPQDFARELAALEADAGPPG